MMVRNYLIAAVLILFGALPIITGVNAPGWVSPIAVIAFSIPVLIALYRLERWRGIAAFAAVGIFAIIIETIGLHTGFPYGSFTYTDHFGLSLPGGAPLFLPFAYVPLVIGAVGLVRARPGLRIALATLLLVAVDLVLDPGAVAFGLWSYAAPGILHGVPLSNFIGWLISGAIATSIAYAFIRSNDRALASSLLLHLSFWTGVVVASGFVIPSIIGLALTYGVARTAPFSRNDES